MSLIKLIREIPKKWSTNSSTLVELDFVLDIRLEQANYNFDYLYDSVAYDDKMLNLWNEL